MTEVAEVTGQKTPVVVQIQGKDIAIHEIKVKNLKAVLGLVGKLSGFLLALKDAPKDDLGSIIPKFLDQIDLIVELTSILSAVPVAEIGEYDLQEIMELMGGCVQANLDFFIQRLLPFVSQAMEAIIAKRNSAAALITGQTPSPS